MNKSWDIPQMGQVGNYCGKNKFIFDSYSTLSQIINGQPIMTVCLNYIGSAIQ